jgi:S1-C subfamily serine protease
MLSKSEPMRFLLIPISICLVSTMSILAATPAATPEVAPTVPAAEAEAGKDVVHQLNNAFAKVFEIVAPSVVIIEISKKPDGDAQGFDDLFFQGQPDENNPRRNPRRPQPVQSEG